LDALLEREPALTYKLIIKTAERILLGYGRYDYAWIIGGKSLVEP
jgi:hypothetical protein